MATISDVAKLTRLSKATVSRVINNHPYISKEKRAIVQDAMKDWVIFLIPQQEG